MSMTRKRKRKILIIVGLLVLLASFGAWFVWLKFFREEDQPPFANAAEQFKYGSIGAEVNRGIPYWIWVVLPRVFPDLLPGPGGYQSFGLVWEEGRELPSGFSKKTVGFPRVANNCAICHTGSWRTAPDEPPQVVVGAASHTADVQGMIRFLYRSANDPRFNADELMPHIQSEVRLSVVDCLLYRYVIIPAAKRELAAQKEAFAWMDRSHMPAWGKGRDDPMNLTKYFMTGMAKDNTTGQADFPSIWNLKVRKGPGLYLNWSCDTPAVRSVIIDSALGLGAAPGNFPNQPEDLMGRVRGQLDWLNWRMKRRAWFEDRMAAVDDFLSELPPPKYPFPIDATLAAKGRPTYDQHCAECHEPGRARTNKPIPIAEIGTDRERMDTWIKEAADIANQRVKSFGINRPDMVKIEAYQSPPLDGLWLRAPYLHNGSVPNLNDLLKPVEQRAKVFYRGYDVYDPAEVGFITSGPAAERAGWRHDVTVRGDSNIGHTYGTGLSAEEKMALVEYLKSL
jgi:mono/diheme cytochrome c family protein